MIPHSKLYEDATRYSHVVSTVVDVYFGASSVPVASNVPVIGGDVVQDRGSKVRWSSSLDLAYNSWETPDNLTAYGSRYKIFRGISSLGRSEMMQLGEYRVDSTERTDRGRIRVMGSSFESYVQDARFERPTTPPYGSSTIAAINTLVDQAVPVPFTLSAQTTRDKRVQATAPWERERIDAVIALADSIEADMYFDYAGRLCVKDKPVLYGGATPVFSISTGRQGVQVSQTQRNTRDGVYNGVSVAGQSTEQNNTVYGFAADTDPTSPTYYEGPFGKKPRFYSSQYITEVAEANRTAESFLWESIAPNTTLVVQTVPVFFLEAGDLVTITMPDGGFETHVIQRISQDLGVRGSFTAEMFVNRSGAGGDL